MPARWALLGCLALSLACAWARAQQTPAELPPAQRPDETDVEYLARVLAAEVGTWRRDGPVQVSAPAELPAELDPRSAALYALTGAARATYRAADGTGIAKLVLAAFPDYLGALGFFTAQRGPQAQRVLLTSPAYRDRDVLHVHAGRFYLRVQASGVITEALPPDQYLASRVEMALPQVEELPRLLRLLPRRWLNALSLRYAPADFLAEGQPPFALTVRHEVGVHPVSVDVVEAADAQTARRYYTELLSQLIPQTAAYAVPRVAEEAFWAAPESGGMMLMRQDQFLARVTGAHSRAEAEAIMRFVSTSVRITRPLPEIAERPRARQEDSRD
ncbi:MAG: DUF6599 family protein [Armatimonadota bacterium]